MMTFLLKISKRLSIGRAMALASCFAVGFFIVPLPSNAQQPTSHNRSTASSEALITRKPLEVVDTYLDQILCSNKSIKLQKENRALALSKQLSADEIEKAFAEEIYYSLKPTDTNHDAGFYRKTYSEMATVLDKLRSMAVFFGHDIHNYFEDENKARRARGQAPYTKTEFITKFESGEITLTAGDQNLNDLISNHLADIERITASVKYGCEGNGNFLHRKGSALTQRANIQGMVLPIGAKAVAVVSRIQHQDQNKPGRAPASTGPSTPSPLGEAAQVARQTTGSRFPHYSNYLRLGVPKAALDEAMAKYFEFKRQGAVTNEKHMVVADYTQNSATPRFWVLNLITGNATGMKMGHGDGKGLLPGRQMMPREVTAFVSNENTSNASAWGAMVFAGPKFKGQDSKFNHASLLEGLEPANANVRARDIIVHEGVNNSGQVYVDDTPGSAAGRSNGCFALSIENAKWVRENLPAGTFLFAHKGNIPEVNNQTAARQAMSRFR
jgi:hypothetical protein